jgi:hypothetical protein
LPSSCQGAAFADYGTSDRNRVLKSPVGLSESRKRIQEEIAKAPRNFLIGQPGETDAVHTIPQDSATSVSQSAEDVARSDDVLPRSAAAWDPDPVEAALARALDRASEAGRFDVVAQLARELGARRLGRARNVVRLEDKRAKREPEE